MLAKFYLYHHWWKGQRVIRDVPVSHYDLRLDEGEETHRYWKMDKDPTNDKDEISAVEDKSKDKRWLTFQGIIQPRGKEDREWLKIGNPNKRIVAHVDRIDSGRVHIIADTPIFISFIFHGNKLSGYWVLKKSTPDETVWIFEKSKLPKTINGNTEKKEVMKKILNRIEPNKIKKLIEMTKTGSSRPDIAKKLNISKSTVYNYQVENELI